MSQYPAPSHTFIRREIAALRKQGLTIVPFSVRPGLGTAEEAVSTVLGRGPWRALRSIAATLASRPARSWRTWRLCLAHREPGLRGLAWAHFHFGESLVLADLLHEAGVGRLHSHFANSGATVGMFASHLLGIPWSVTLHGISELDGTAGRLLPDKLRRAEFVACASWFMKAQGMRVSPPDTWPKFLIVRCGVDLSQMPSNEPRAMPGPVRFIAVGRISAEKGYPGLIEAFSRVVASGLDARLTIVGDGPLRAETAGRLQSLGLERHVRMLGALPEAGTLAEIARADILVLSSLMEGLPVVLMEAMAVGATVIAPAIAGIPELVTDHQSGLLFRPADWGQLAEQMLLLGSDADLRRRLAGAARARVEQEFSVDVAVERLGFLLGRDSLSTPLEGEAR